MENPLWASVRKGVHPRVKSVPHGRQWSILFLLECFSHGYFTKTIEHHSQIAKNHDQRPKITSECGRNSIPCRSLVYTASCGRAASTWNHYIARTLKNMGNIMRSRVCQIWQHVPALLLHSMPKTPTYAVPFIFLSALLCFLLGLNYAWLLRQYSQDRNAGCATTMYV